jgi:hypothetical protein
MLLPFYVMLMLPMWLAGALIHTNNTPKEATA